LTVNIFREQQRKPGPDPDYFQDQNTNATDTQPPALPYLGALAPIPRGLTSTDEAKTQACVQTLQTTHAGTGYLHESFHKDDPAKYTRA
jgi:meiotically up-regulated gene 157 (Mug157) protein